jgi:hypothetical protein
VRELSILDGQPPLKILALEHAWGLQLPNAHAEWGDVDLDNVTPHVERLSIRYGFSHHHSWPTSVGQLRDYELQDCSVTFKLGHADAERMLRARFGEPRRVTERIDMSRIGKSPIVIDYSMYGPYFVSHVHEGRFSLKWYRTTPDWALSPLDGVQRLAAFRRLLDAAAHCNTFDDLERELTASGVTGVERNRYDHAIQLRLVPAIDATELAHALGWGDVFGTSGDVHMSSWHVEKIIERDGLQIRHERPRAGRWTIDAKVEAWPSGGKLTTHRGHSFGPRDVVRWLSFEMPAYGHQTWTSNLIDPEDTAFIRDEVTRRRIIMIGRNCLPYDACLPDRVFAQAASGFAWSTCPLVELWELIENVAECHGEGELFIVAPEPHVDPERSVLRIGVHATEEQFKALVTEREQMDHPTIEWIFGHHKKMAMFVDHHAGLIVIGTTRGLFNFQERRGRDKLVTQELAIQHVLPRLPEDVRDAWAARLRESYHHAWRP